jgi:hypothetical protein
MSSSVSFPDHVYEFASKRYGLKTIVASNCWGMISSMEIQRGRNIGVDLCSKFIEESYDTVDLLFFLFMRNNINKVMAEADGERKGASQDNEISKKKTPLAGTSMDLKQVVQVVKMSIESKTQDLRDQIIKKLDLAMAAKVEGHARKAPTLDPDHLLAISVEQYHLSRAQYTEGPLALADGGASTTPTFEELSKEMQQEVTYMSNQLLRSLTSSGETAIDPKQVREWALQTAMRRQNIGADSPPAIRLTDWVENALVEQERKDAFQLTAEAMMPSSEILSLSPAEFESDLENNVRQLLLNATAELIDDVLTSLPQKSSTENSDSAKAMKSALISEFAPMADVLMEAIVGQNYKKWLEVLGITVGTDKLRENFDELHKEFQTVLGSTITVEAVQQICQTVVDPDEFYDLVRDKARTLARKEGESCSDVEDFGAEAF